jgi:threonine/homoserine/homoserine lactone efflux protein
MPSKKQPVSATAPYVAGVALGFLVTLASTVTAFPILMAASPNYGRTVYWLGLGVFWFVIFAAAYRASEQHQEQERNQQRAARLREQAGEPR